MDERQALGCLDLYHAQLRGRVLGERGDLIGWLSPAAEDAGPVARMFDPVEGRLLLYPAPTAAGGWDPDMLIAGECARSVAMNVPLTWYCRDDASDGLPAGLRAAGFVAEDREYVMVGRSADIATGPGAHPALPEGFVVRQVATAQDFTRVRELTERARGGCWSWLPPALEHWAADERDPAVVTVVETPDGDVAAATLLRCHTGTDFASLWSTSTLPAWRGRGLYRLLVGHRAALAARRGHRYLYVEALPASRPILTRLGMAVASTQTPYRLTPLTDDNASSAR
ncbi:GNAT family N-acetyltransferase [Streptomyces sp. NBC_01237]|uniref:GNAT family N-acetyltransferase n=1 Tax=Streptomyces sp. NBC_01237 TaxID=2903790 RepID=UPI002DD8F6D2|nr:GNAT family N-acetyltransferase [Streptomyces sp. NBC_01237]WRZ76406.1 GNAT family N-acetyltransferase [Streptomyces sp. NBC_01237]